MNMYNPYIQQMPQTQDLGGLNPVFQNISAQQAMQQQALQQGMDLTNQAGMTVDGKQAGAGYNQIAMANALRKPQTQEQINARDVQMGGMGTYNPYTQCTGTHKTSTGFRSEVARRTWY